MVRVGERLRLSSPTVNIKSICDNVSRSRLSQPRPPFTFPCDFCSRFWTFWTRDQLSCASSRHQRSRTVPANDDPKNLSHPLGAVHHPQRGPLSGISSPYRGDHPSSSPALSVSSVHNAFHSTPTYHPVWRTRDR